MLVPGFSVAAQSIEGIVRYVIDGDTVVLQPDAGKPIKLRLIGLDAPEIDRRLVKLTLDGDDVGAWLVLQGHAWNVRYRGRSGPYTREERAARAARRGVFATPDAMPPRSFRRQHGSCYPVRAP